MFLERTVENLIGHIQGCTVEPVFNLDEVGISDSEDRKTRKLIVPATMRSETIHHGISRDVKHISVINCAFAAGQSLIPAIIPSHDSASVQEQLKKHNVRSRMERLWS
jgi:hypothetical protein